MLGRVNIMNFNFIDWFDFPKLVSLAALCISLLSLYFSYDRSQLAKAQEARKLPNLVLNLVHGQFQQGDADNGRLYAFKLMVNNRADNRNAINAAKLSVTFLTETRILMKMVLIATDVPKTGFIIQEGQTLSVPIEVDAHNSVAGWVYFHAAEGLIKGRHIEQYVLEITDTYNNLYSVSEKFLQEVGF